MSAKVDKTPPGDCEALSCASSGKFRNAQVMSITTLSKELFNETMRHADGGPPALNEPHLGFYPGAQTK